MRYYVTLIALAGTGLALAMGSTWAALFGLQYGSVRTPFTYEFIEEWLRKAGFREVTRCVFKETHSACPDIVQLDNRERESLFVEAQK
jgi:hypothetical protein